MTNTPNPQANTLDEIRDSHTMKLVPMSQRELFWSELEPQIQALITEARIDEHKVFWEIVPSDAEHVETLKDISNLRLIKLGAKLDD